jgi:hypothetical protein
VVNYCYFFISGTASLIRSHDPYLHEIKDFGLSNIFYLQKKVVHAEIEPQSGKTSVNRCPLRFSRETRDADNLIILGAYWGVSHVKNMCHDKA